MGFWDRLRGAQKPEPTFAQGLREALFERVARRDARGLSELCRAQETDIVRHFPAWIGVPPEVRSSPEAVRRYAQGLMAIATLFDRELGDRSLVALLVGNPDKNPILRWQKMLGEIRGHMDSLRYAEAIHGLGSLLVDMDGKQGTGIDQYRAIAQGWFGESYFHSGEALRALEPTSLALALCERQGDVEGVVAYLGNRYEILRYLGDSAAAGVAADQLADVLERAGRGAPAARYRRQAAIVRSGEPLNRVVAHVGDDEYELPELPLLRGQAVRFEFRRNRIVLRPATELTQAGARLGSKGQYDQALELFHRAARADAYDPHSRYEAAVTLLHLRRYREAGEFLDETEALAPGWFLCRADRWLAAKLEEGEVDHGVFEASRVLQDGPQSPAEKVRLAESTLAVTPTWAPLHLFKAEALFAAKRTTEAQKAFRRGLGCSPDPDTRTRLLVGLAASLDPTVTERHSLLESAVSLAGNLTAAATATTLLRQTAT